MVLLVLFLISLGAPTCQADEIAPEAAGLLRRAHAAFLSGEPVDSSSCSNPAPESGEAVTNACSLVAQVAGIQSGNNGTRAGLVKQALAIMDTTDRFEALFGGGRPSDEVILRYRGRSQGTQAPIVARVQPQAAVARAKSSIELARKSVPPLPTTDFWTIGSPGKGPGAIITKQPGDTYQIAMFTDWNIFEKIRFITVTLARPPTPFVQTIPATYRLGPP